MHVLRTTVGCPQDPKMRMSNQIQSHSCNLGRLHWILQRSEIMWGELCPQNPLYTHDGGWISLLSESEADNHQLIT